LVIPEGHIQFEPLPVGPIWEEYRTPEARKLAKAFSLPAINERYIDTVECYAPYSVRAPVAWHDFKRAKEREKRRNVYDRQRRVRRNHAFDRLSALVNAIRRIEMRFERSARIVSLAMWIHFMTIERARERQLSFERKIQNVKEKYHTIFRGGMVRLLGIHLTGWAEVAREEKRKKRDAEVENQRTASKNR
jgi:hypothetical protein